MATGRDLMAKAGISGTVKVDSLKPLRDVILVKGIHESFAEERRSKAGLIIMADKFDGAAIRPRWAQVYAVAENVDDYDVGQWVLIEHGRWSRSVTIEDPDAEVIINRVDPDGVMGTWDGADKPVNNWIGVAD